MFERCSRTKKSKYLLLLVLGCVVQNLSGGCVVHNHESQYFGAVFSLAHRKKGLERDRRTISIELGGGSL